ncbi:unnamed protein product [Ectocarpus sp. 12 AP-2014]
MTSELLPGAEGSAVRISRRTSRVAVALSMWIRFLAPSLRDVVNRGTPAKEKKCVMDTP